MVDWECQTHRHQHLMWTKRVLLYNICNITSVVQQQLFNTKGHLLPLPPLSALLTSALLPLFIRSKKLLCWFLALCTPGISSLLPFHHFKPIHLYKYIFHNSIIISYLRYRVKNIGSSEQCPKHLQFKAMVFPFFRIHFEFIFSVVFVQIVVGTCLMAASPTDPQRRVVSLIYLVWW